MSHEEAAADDDPSLLSGPPSSVVGPGLASGWRMATPVEELGLDGTKKAAESR